MKFNMLILVTTTVVVILVSIYAFDDIFIGSLVGLFIVLFLFIMPVVMYYSIKLRKWLNILLVNCDPVTFIEMGNGFINNKQYNQFIIKLNQSTGLIENGDFEQAKTMLLSFDLNAVEFKNIPTKLVYYCNLFFCYLRLNQQDEAYEVYNQLKSIRITNHKQLEVKKNIELHYLLSQGQYDDCKQLLEREMNNCVTNSNYVNKLYCLAQIELEEGYVDSAKEKLTEVVQKGNKLYIAQQAKQRLEQLNS